MPEEVTSHAALAEASMEATAPDAPEVATPLAGELGENPFETSWTHDQTLQPQPEAVGLDAGGEEAATAPASDDPPVETPTVSDTVEDSQVTPEPEAKPTPTQSPEYMLLQQQNADLVARLERVESSQTPEVEAPPEGIPWDGLDLGAGPDELADFQPELDKRTIKVAEFVINHIQNLNAQVDQQQAQAAVHESLQSQVTEMVNDPAYAGVDAIYPKMKEIAAAAPAMLQQPNGLKAIYIAAGGVVGAAAPVGDYANGVKAGLAASQSKRAAAIDAPKPATSNSVASEPGGLNLSQSIDYHFNKSLAEARKR